MNSLPLHIEHVQMHFPSISDQTALQNSTMHDDQSTDSVPASQTNLPTSDLQQTTNATTADSDVTIHQAVNDSFVTENGHVPPTNLRQPHPRAVQNNYNFS